jgi:drug/metabolite transporter (DMT)-like permease
VLLSPDSPITAGELAALGTAACWVGTALAFEAAGRRIGSLTVNLLRLPMALVLLAGVAWVLRGQALPTDATPHAWGWLAVSGLVGFTFGDLCLFRAFLVLGPRLSTLVMSMAPPIAALLGWALLGEVLSGRDLMGMGMTVAGVAWAVLERRPAAPLETVGEAPAAGTALPAPRRRPAVPAPTLAGLLLALGGAAGQGGGLVLSKLGMGDYSPVASTQIRVLAGFAGYLVLFTAIGWWRRVPKALRDGRALGWTAVGSFFGPFLGVTLSLVAVQVISAGVAASLMATTPILIIPVVVLLGRERVGWGGWGGALLAVAGVAVLVLG